MAERFSKQILRQQAVTYWIQSGNPYLPLRYAWRLDGAKGVGWVLRGRLRGIFYG